MRLAKGTFQALSVGMLGQGHGLYCRTLGSSMFPLIRTGSLLQVEPTERDQVRPGDVLLYRKGEALVAHRLLRTEIRRGKTVLITRGDAFPWHAVERLDPGQILGRVVAIEWRQGLKVRIDRNPGRWLCIWLAKISPFLLAAYMVLSKIKQGLPSLLPWRRPRI